MRIAVVSALGVTILLGTPLLARADQGKWWTPKDGNQGVERRDRGQGSNDQGSWGDRGTNDRGTSDRRSWGGRRGNDGGSWGDRGWSGRVTYRDRGWNGRGSWATYRSWRGVPVRRDVIVIRDRRHGGYFRARRVFVQPRFYRGSLYVRPVRYFIAADACIGGISIHTRIVRPHYLYGCNFCDERFDSYEAYAAHVAHCDLRPDEYAIQACNWDDGYDTSWDGPYHAGDEGDNNYDYNE